MLINYLKIALRNIYKEKFYTFINISGLAIGMAAGLVILMYVLGETGYDREFKDSDRIHRIGVSFMNLGNFANAPEQLKDVLTDQIPEVEQSVRIRHQDETNITINDQAFQTGNIYYVDTNFFEIFNYPFIEGQSQFALKDPNDIVITKKLARQLFGDEPAFGQTMEIGEDNHIIQVAGVVDDEKIKSHLVSNIWLPISSILTYNNSWTNASFYTYAKLNEGITKEQFVASLEKLRKDVVYPTMDQSTPYEEWAELDKSFRFFVEPIEDIYLKSTLIFQLQPGGNLNYVYIFSVISFLILVIAAVNFINLSTARSTRRAREVGIRKTMGSSKLSLILQFLIESVSISFIAMILAFGLAELFVIVFEQVSGLSLISDAGFRFNMIKMILLISLGVGLLAGLYPAFFLSSFEPSDVLKGSILQAKGSGDGITLRSLLVVFQFTISICLIICSIIVFKQLSFLRNKDLGFIKENVIVISNISELGANGKVFRETLSQKSYVNYSSLSSRVPGGSTMWVTSYKTDAMNDFKNYNTFLGDYDYINSLGIEILEGRGFNPDLASDSLSVLVNEAAVRDLEMGENAVGTKLNKELEIIGIVKDFNFQSLQKNVEPVVIKLTVDKNYKLVNSIQLGSEKQLLLDAQEEWLKYSPNEAMDYYFVADNFEEMLQRDKVLGNAIGLFTMLAILISCMGLFGLAAYTSEQRTKEIGVRKVFGATTKNIIFLVSGGFMTPIIISFIIATPVSIFIISKWLDQFAYKTQMHPLIFVVSIVGALLLAWFTVLYYSANLAMMNPVDSLKEE